MSKQANPKLIGGFVVGAAALLVVALLCLGSGEFMADTVNFVMFFEGSVGGLTVGAPVLFQGAPIGQVTDIVLEYDTVKQEPRIPVYVEFDRRNVKIIGKDIRKGEGFNILVEHGLKAQLITQSMITGLKTIQLDFFPDVPLKLVGTDPTVPELPTAPSLGEKLGKLFKELQKIPLTDTVADIRHAVQGFDELVRSPELKKAISTLDATLLDYQKLAQDVDAQIEPLSSSLDSTLSDARDALKQAKNSIAKVEDTLDGTLTDIRRLANDVDEKIDPVTASFEETLQDARDALKQAKSTLATAEDLLAQDSPTVYRLDEALVQVTAAFRAIRDLAQYLEQHPDALIQGKHPPGGP